MKMRRRYKLGAVKRNQKDFEMASSLDGAGAGAGAAVGKDSGAFVCRSTVENPYIVADDRGKTCSRSMLDVQTGCCPKISLGSAKTVTQGCRNKDVCDPKTKCCASYESCISCCMQNLSEMFLSPGRGNSVGADSVALRTSFKQVPQHFGRYFSMKATLLGRTTTKVVEM